MSDLRPCYRHRRRGLWMVGCPDCTAWHLAAAKAGRDAQPTALRSTAHPAA
jgi:hypothetical protein